MWRAGRERSPRALDAVEVAESAALGDLVAVVCVLTRLVPVGPLAQVVAAFPLAVLALRRPGRAGGLGVMAAGVVALLVGGLGPSVAAVSAGLFGWLVGVGARRGWGTGRTAVTGVATVAVPAGVVGVVVLVVFGGYRALVLEQLGNAWSGAARLARGIGVPDVLVAVGDLAVRFAIEWWWVALPVSVALSTLVGLAITSLVLARPLRSVRALLPIDRAGRLPAGGDGPVAPLPVRLRDVALPGGRRVDLDLEAGRFVVVTGANGAGKSTLGRVLAGQAPSGGSVQRPGDAGLGRVGGTGMIFQNPESQVLGVRAGDDLRWGLPPGNPVPVEELLGRVGLAGHDETETATFSGGQLQRLAVAALLARRPALVISDESTAMLDPEGRDQVTSLLRSLAHGRGRGVVDDRGRARIAVVHITHHRVDGADDVVALTGAPGRAPAPAGEPWGPPRPALGGALRLRGVDIVHDPGSPWRRPVLTGVDLTIPAGAAVLVTGPNGAGKTSLAWVLAGLSSPTRGTATLDGAPLRNGRGNVLLAVQHARPALLQPTVGEEVADAAGVGPHTADTTLAALGLDPQLYRDRAIEELSGGEQRRVLLAGLLGAGPRALVLDEPLAGLDATAAGAVHDALAAARAAGITLVVTTHDPASLIDLADATVHVTDGTIEGPPGIVGASRPAPGRERRGRAASGVLRTLPGSSPLHRLWAGTKVAALLALALTLAIDPAWSTLAGATAVLIIGAIAARLPRRAVPRPPRWLLLWVLPAVLAALGTRPPLIQVGGTSLSLGGLEGLVLLLGTTLVSLLGTALLVATTPLGAFPPLLQHLARRSGSRTAVSTITLGLRLMPLLLAEGRTTWLLLGQRRYVERVSVGLRERARHGVHTALLGCAMAVRRAGDMGEAINARGGFGAVSGPDRRPGYRDLLAATVVAAILAVALAV